MVNTETTATSSADVKGTNDKYETALQNIFDWINANADFNKRQRGEFTQLIREFQGVIIHACGEVLKEK